MSVPSLTSLLKQSDITDHDEALAAADAVLKGSKGDLQAQHVKVVALLKLDRFEDAVRAVETGDSRLKEQAKLEYAYALYKNGQRKAAAEIAQDATSRGLKHVEAQALYGLEDFVKSSALYKDLVDSDSQSQHDNQADLRVNTLAVNAQLEWNQLGQHAEEKMMTREDFEAHETVYNTACNSIARGELGQCEVLLKRAKYLCEKLEDLSDEDKASEMLPITIQHIFVLTRQGRLEEAQELLDSLDLTKIADATTRYLAQVNREAASITSPNPYLLERRLAVDLDSFEPSPVFAFQKTVITRNKYALDLASMKFEGTAQNTQRNIAQHAGSRTDAARNSLSVANAAAHAHNQTGKEAIEHILPLLERRPQDAGLILTIVQLYVLANNINTATEHLQKFLARLEQAGSSDDLDLRYAPGLVGCLVSLYVSQGRIEMAKDELSRAASHWKGQSGDFTPGVLHLLKAAGSALLAGTSLQQGETDLAKSIFESLQQRDPHDRYAAAGLLAASSGTASDAAQLTPIDRLVGEINVEDLEQAGVARRKSSDQQNTSRKRAAPDEGTQAKAKKKLRKSKMPKDYDPAKKPDPERWLPLRDRSTYKPKGKKSKARQAMLSQGAAVSESDGSRPATPGAEVVKGKAAQGGGGGAKKKKPKKK